MKEPAELVGISFMMPEIFVPTWWLSILNCADDFLNKKDVYALFSCIFRLSNQMMIDCSTKQILTSC